MSFRLRAAAIALVVLAVPASVLAQYNWGRDRTPPSGVCFYEHINFGGRYFCAPVGEEQGRVPRGTNDEISSIRIFGRAEVIVFRADNWRGDSRRFSSSVRDLRRSGFNDRLSSFVVVRSGGGWGNQGPGGGPGAGWGDRPGPPQISYRQAEAMVRRAYQRVCRRAPDPAARPWIDEVIRRNWSQRELEDALRDTPEGRRR